LLLQQTRAQTSYPDSLKSILAEAPNDSVRFSINFDLANYYFDRDRRQTYEHNEVALTIARENDKMLDVAKCLGTKGYYLNKEDRYGEALKCYLEGLNYAENPRSEKQTWLKPPDADPFQFRMQVLAGLIHDFGHVFWSTGNYQQAIYQFRSCLSYLDKALPTSHNSALMNIGAVYLNLNQLDSALYYERKAIAKNHMTYRSTMLKYIGDIYLRQGAYDSARFYYQQGIKVAREQSKTSGLAIGYMGLTQYYLSLENPDSSLYYAGEFLKAFRKLHGNPIKDINISIPYELMFRAYQLKGQNDSTLKYLQLAFNSRDSISKKKIRSLTEFQNLSFEEQLRLEELEKEKLETQSKIRVYSLLAGLFLILVIAGAFYRQSRQKQKANRVLQNAYTKLQTTQTQLIHAEKMASLGELTAGIAHEIQNPLNFVKNFSEVSGELIDEMKEELAESSRQLAVASQQLAVGSWQLVEEKLKLVDEISDDLKQNLVKISHHGQRASSIVNGMLEHSRSSDGQKELTDINLLADEYLRLAYHGLRAKDKSFNADFKTEFDEKLPKVKVIPQDIGRVLLNLINNAFYAVHQKTLTGFGTLSGLDKQGTDKPLVTLATLNLGDSIKILVKDNGPGIPADIKDKIFQPFFTTKPTGEGTGLGLSMSYDIISKGHGGSISLETQEGKGTEFIIQLPIKGI
jgi:signal transduction histidine kinase